MGENGDMRKQLYETELLLEKECRAEVSVVLQGFKDRAKAEQSAFVNATDSEHWFCVCFQSHEAKDEFLEKTGLKELGDKYLSGHDAANVLGVKLDTPKLARIKPFKPKQRWKNLT